MDSNKIISDFVELRLKVNEGIKNSKLETRYLYRQILLEDPNQEVDFLNQKRLNSLIYSRLKKPSLWSVEELFRAVRVLGL